jgi:hypothetical protein
MTAEEKDQEWRNALACYGYDVTGSVDDIVRKVAQVVQERDWRWREEIQKYLPQLSVMSFCGPTSTIKWLMEYVTLNPEAKELADKLLGVQASDMSEDDKSEATLRSIFPNLGPRIK